MTEESQNLENGFEKNGKSKMKNKKARVDETNFFGYIWFLYVLPLFWKGYRQKGLHPTDIGECSKDDASQKLCEKLRKEWLKTFTKNGNKASFTWAMFRAFYPSFLIPLFFSLFEECLIRVAQPLLLGQVIRYFSGSKDVSMPVAYYSGLGVCLCTVVYITTHHPLMAHLSRLGMRLRVASTMLLYQKSLKLSRASINQISVGHIVNMMTNDMQRFDDFALASCYLITGPVQMIIIIYIVWETLGVSSLPGVGVLLLLIPFQSIMGKCFSIVRAKTTKLTDKRLKFMNEIISGIRVIKMYNWEKPFADRISEARKNEVKQIRKSLCLKAINVCMFFVASRILLFACLLVYALLQNVLTAEKVFVTMAMLNTVRLTMTLMFPNAITSAAELNITIKRIRRFLTMEEIDEKMLVNTNNEHFDKNAQVIVENICASYNPASSYPTLQNISVSLKPGDFLAVIGKVGSSKTAFIMSLLGELPITSGSIKMKGSVAYASQETWSFNDSIRQNILFGKDYDEELYRKVIEVCALERDLRLMPLGDRTIVGEKGVQLSGGQKARLTLARAVYRQSDIFLMDDPLSAVDSGVAEHILEKCILEHLNDKIRILVTHQIQFVEKATKILVLQDGQCLAFGTYKELERLGIDFMSLMEADPSNQNENENERDRKTSELSIEMSELLLSTTGKNSCLHGINDHSEMKKITRLSESNKDEHPDGEEDVDERTPALQEEKRFSGAIKGRIYSEYFRAGATWFLTLTMIISSIISQVFLSWLRYILGILDK